MCPGNTTTSTAAPTRSSTVRRATRVPRGPRGASDDTVSGFSAAGDRFDLRYLLLSQKSLVDKGMSRRLPDAATPGYFGTAGVGVEYGTRQAPRRSMSMPKERQPRRR